MSFDYAQSAQEVVEALADAGAPCSLTWTPPPATDDPLAEPPAPVTVTAYAAIFDYSARQIGTQLDSLIVAGDRQILMAVFDVNGNAVPEPLHGATVSGPDGNPYVLKACKALAPAGVAVMYDLNVKK